MLEVARRLHDLDVTVFLPEQYTVAGVPDHVCRGPLIDCIAGAEVAVVIGGDGSILRIAEPCAIHNVPIVAVDMGTLGFMCEIAPDELELLREVVSKKYDLDRRMMIEAQVMRNGECVYSGHALNDVVINRGSGAKILDMDIFADGQLITKFRADGVIVATPTGSTAYSMAAGGPIIDPDEHNMTVTPICAHGLYAKSFVLAARRVVKIQMGMTKNHVALISIDGRAGFQMMPQDTVVIRESMYTTDLISIKGKSVYEVIRNKLNYGI